MRTRFVMKSDSMWRFTVIFLLLGIFVRINSLFENGRWSCTCVCVGPKHCKNADLCVKSPVTIIRKKQNFHKSWNSENKPQDSRLKSIYPIILCRSCIARASSVNSAQTINKMVNEKSSDFSGDPLIRWSLYISRNPKSRASFHLILADFAYK